MYIPLAVGFVGLTVVGSEHLATTMKGIAT
jgi:hypothetical protein